MRLEQARRGIHSAQQHGEALSSEALGVIEYKKRPKSEKFKLHNWEQIQHVLDTALQSRDLVAGVPGATTALVEQLVQRYTIGDSNHLRESLLDTLTPHRALDAAINSAVETLAVEWQLSCVPHSDTCHLVFALTISFAVHLQIHSCGSQCSITAHVMWWSM